jgi:hypothetical protein
MAQHGQHLSVPVSCLDLKIRTSFEWRWLLVLGPATPARRSLLLTAFVCGSRCQENPNGLVGACSGLHECLHGIKLCRRAGCWCTDSSMLALYVTAQPEDICYAVLETGMHGLGGTVQYGNDNTPNVEEFCYLDMWMKKTTSMSFAS